MFPSILQKVAFSEFCGEELVVDCTCKVVMPNFVINLKSQTLDMGTIYVGNKSTTNIQMLNIQGLTY